MSTLPDRLKEAMTLRDMTQADIVRQTGINKSALSCYISGKYLPKQNAIYKLAKALNVNETWLMGVEGAPIERISDADRFRKTAEAWNETHAFAPKVSKEEFEILKKFRTLDARGKANVMTVLNNEYQFVKESQGIIDSEEFLAAHGAVKLTEEQKQEIQKFKED